MACVKKKKGKKGGSCSMSYIPTKQKQNKKISSRATVVKNKRFAR